MNLLKLIEELAKYSILPAEVNSLFRLLRPDAQFDYRKLLLETILRITQHRSSAGSMPDNFLDIQTNTSGITIPEIRKWETTHGFVFHAWLRLEEERSIAQNYRRQLFSLTTNYGTGYEFFVQKNGNFVVSVITKKEFFTATVTSPQLLDGRWHSVTVSVVPPKRLFSYHQINVYLDSVQKLGSTMKYASFAEVFHYCSIGAPYNNFRKVSHTSHQSNSARMSPVPDPGVASPSSEREEKTKPSGLFPNLIERTFFPGLVSQVPNYFTLPSKSTSSLDPSVKSYPIGMQDLVFGEAICLKGQLGAVLLADTNINLKSLFEAGPSVANVLATDMIESFWRSYLRGHHADYASLGYKISQLQPEIVPFIYDCFQGGKVTKHARIGKDLVHILGAVIAGSQVTGVPIPSRFRLRRAAILREIGALDQSRVRAHCFLFVISATLLAALATKWTFGGCF